MLYHAIHTSTTYTAYASIHLTSDEYHKTSAGLFKLNLGGIQVDHDACEGGFTAIWLFIRLNFSLA